MRGYFINKNLLAYLTNLHKTFKKLVCIGKQVDILQ